MAVPFPVPAGRSLTADLVQRFSVGERYLQRDTDLFLRDVWRYAAGISEEYGDHLLPGICHSDGGHADLCGIVYDGAKRFPAGYVPADGIFK